MSHSNTVANTVSQSLALSMMMNLQALESVETAPVVRAATLPALRVVRTSAKHLVPSTNGQSSKADVISGKPGSVDAAGFMKAWRNAANRDEQIAAIGQYTGYNMTDTFAVNEYKARTAAQKALKPIASTDAVTEVGQKVTGPNRVQGVPDFTARRINDLLGREQLAAAALVEHELAAANLTEGSTQQLTALGMAEIERERLLAIRSDLKTLTR